MAAVAGPNAQAPVKESDLMKAEVIEQLRIVEERVMGMTAENSAEVVAFVEKEFIEIHEKMKEIAEVLKREAGTTTQT